MKKTTKTGETAAERAERARKAAQAKKNAAQRGTVGRGATGGGKLSPEVEAERMRKMQAAKQRAKGATGTIVDRQAKARADAAKKRRNG